MRKRKKALSVTNNYEKFLHDFGFDIKYGLKTWDDVLKFPKQDEVPVPRRPNEGLQHWKGKRNIIELFKEYNEKSFRFLIWSEVQQVIPSHIEAFDGERSYEPDIIIFDKIAFSKKHPHYGIYIIEIDGKENHFNPHEVYKDSVRDDHFFDTYNAVTIRIIRWFATGRQCIYNEFSDVNDMMIYTANEQKVDQNKRLGKVPLINNV
ncbi:MAG: hypothetical protein R2685_10765 [Candidatus Nitrosocosmicus sp.]|nr:hypothetical protein [Candidatus Nitrosocosmicus sp.]